MPQADGSHLPKCSILFVLGIAAVFSIVSICARIAYDAGSNALTVITLRTALVASVLFLFLRARRISWQLPSTDRKRALALGALLAVSTWALNKALEIIPVAIAILIYFTYPLLTGIASWVSGTERFSARVAITLVLAFSGVALTLQVADGPLSIAGLMYAIAASVGWGMLLYLTGRLFHGGDSRPRTLYMMLSAAALLIGVCAFTGDVSGPTGLRGWIGFAAVPFLYGIAIVGTMAAVSTIGVVKTSVYMNFEPVATIFLSALVLDQYMSPIQLAGAVLVILALSIYRTPTAKVG